MNFGVVFIIFLWVMVVGSVNGGIGANWGTQTRHPLEKSITVKLLKDNGFPKVKLFDADRSSLNALRGSGMEIMVGIPNDMLYSLATSVAEAEEWVEKNVSAHVSSGSLNIKYVAVGNEPFLSAYNGSFLETTLPALQNIQAALIKAGLGSQVQVTVPLNADVYQSSTNLPSTGDFRSDIHDIMVEIVKFLSDNGAPFTVNIYPFISLSNDANFPIDYAFFDGYSSPINDNGLLYYNVFDANHDTLVWALHKNGYGNMSIIVGEIGWPTDGDQNANVKLAQRFNQGLTSHMGKGTPMRPGPIDAYLFSLIDEDAKSIEPGDFERHWGIFNYDATPKYNLRLGSTGRLVGASNVQYLSRKWCVMSPSASLEDPQVAASLSYACANADCTSLGYGASCANLDELRKISYAFNSYYQQNNQVESTCHQFSSLSVITSSDPSTADCKFDVMIQPTSSYGNVDANVGYSKKPVGSMMFIFMLLLVAL